MLNFGGVKKKDIIIDVQGIPGNRNRNSEFVKV